MRIGVRATIRHSQSGRSDPIYASPARRSAVSKYQPLAERLAVMDAHLWRPTFAELEQIVGAALPKRARTREDWWLKGGAHARAWADAGWTVDHVDLEEGAVKFRRLEPAQAETETREAAATRTPRLGWRAVVGGAALTLVGLAVVSAARRRGPPRVSFAGKRRRVRGPRR